MKWAGFADAAPRRVIDSDEVLLASRVSGLRIGLSLAKISRLIGSSSVAELDHQIGGGQGLHVGRRGDAFDRYLAVGLGDLLRSNLARHVAADGGKARLDAVLGDIVDQHVKTGEGADVGDAASHLSGADDANRPDLVCHEP